MQVAATVRLFGSRYINCYLVEEKGRLTLLDAGLPGYWGRLLRELRTMGRTLADIDAVLVTHSHPDHTGLAERARVAAGATVYAHSLDAPVIRGQVNDGGPPAFLKQGFHPFLLGYLVHAIRSGAARRTPVELLTEFADGEVLDVPGHPRVVHAPGHTAGSCALHLEAEGVLFSGDSLVTVDLRSGRSGPSIAPDFVNESSGQALASLGRLEGLRAGTLLPGHGKPWHGGVSAAVEIARAAAAAAGEIAPASPGSGRSATHAR